ncbi:hypothetical protein [Aurantibacillus circumpalustris]|uniref:hypothetical protein n=1 Tax=Aurantibacillus circumpalustris TaxID=3036359 RepID=UPI00295B30E9|nr:hypothetical protein [Aurantibacillus circumpalustris]
MKSSKFLVFILLLCSLISSAQLMNVRKWRGSERDSLDKGLEMFDEKMFLRALPIFESLLSQHPKEEFLKYSYAKCALYRSDKHEVAYNYFVEVYNNNKKVPDIQYDMALAALYNYKFDEATDYINQYAESRRTDIEGKKNAETLKRNITYAKYYLANPTNAKVKNVGNAINTEYDEYVPAITADESALIFTYAGSKSIGGRVNEELRPDKYGNFLEDIYISYKENGKFQPAVPLDSLNTSAPDAAISLSEDGRILFIYQDIGDGHGDIYQSVIVGDRFSEPKKLRGEVNSYSWDGHCSLSPDGNTLYFSSERAGGFGGRDIYKANLILPDSIWGNVVNLGDSVNTPYDDDAPFIHSDGITLFYSSKGRTSMGGYDIFRTVMNLADSTFRKTENLGYPINSTADDIYFVLGASGNTGYYSSGKKDGMGMKDIYQVEPNFNWPKSPLYLVKGKVKNGSTGIEADIKVEITSKNNKLYKTLKSKSKTGEYLVSLPPGVSYQLTYSYKSFPEKRLNINAVDITGYMEKVNDVNFEEKVDVLASNNAKLPVSPKEDAEIKTTTAPEIIASVTKTVTQEPVIAKNTVKPAVKEEPKEEEEVINHVGAKEAVKSETVAVVEKKSENEVAAAPVEVNFGSVNSPVRPQNAVVSAPGNFTANPVTSTPLNLPSKSVEKEKVAAKTGDFVPVNGPQAKSIRFADKYGDVSAIDMEFRVQVAAVKVDKNVRLANQELLGKIEKLDLNDGYTRITVGGSFKTLGEALQHNKKIVKLGQKEGFIISLYKGERVTLDKLESMGLLK